MNPWRVMRVLAASRLVAGPVSVCWCWGEHLQHSSSSMDRYDCTVLSDYLTNPYILPSGPITLSLARAAKTSPPGSYYCYHTRCRQNLVESVMKQSLARRSSFSLGSKLRGPEQTFSFRQFFKSKPSSCRLSEAGSTVSLQSNKSTEEFWNQYRRHQPKLSLTLRTKQVAVKPVVRIDGNKTPPTLQHSSISLW